MEGNVENRGIIFVNGRCLSVIKGRMGFVGNGLLASCGCV